MYISWPVYLAFEITQNHLQICEVSLCFRSAISNHYKRCIHIINNWHIDNIWMLMLEPLFTMSLSFAPFSPQTADEVQCPEHVSHWGWGQRGALPLQAAGSLPQWPCSCHTGGQLGGHCFLPAGRGQCQGAGHRSAGSQLRSGPQPLAGRTRALPSWHCLLLLRATKWLGPLCSHSCPALDQVLWEPGSLQPCQVTSAMTGAVPEPDTRRVSYPSKVREGH